EFADSEAFTRFIKESIEKDAPPGEFEPLENVVQYSAERPYPCLRHHGTALDRKRRAAAVPHRPLRLEVISLYCRHPSRPDLGFMASFSHRGGPGDPYFSADAEKFIDAVQARPSSPASAP